MYPNMKTDIYWKNNIEATEEVKMFSAQLFYFIIV